MNKRLKNAAIASLLVASTQLPVHAEQSNFDSAISSQELQQSLLNLELDQIARQRIIEEAYSFSLHIEFNSDDRPFDFNQDDLLNTYNNTLSN